MSNPHRVRVTETHGAYHATCAADGCDWSWTATTYTDATVRGLTHQASRRDVRTIRRRVDWQEPVEDT